MNINDDKTENTSERPGRLSSLSEMDLFCLIWT